jgi:hypothetical protein
MMSLTMWAHLGTSGLVTWHAALGQQCVVMLSSHLTL